MRRDEQVKACIALKKNFVVNTGWEIVCDEEKIKTWVTEMLQDISADRAMEQNFNDILRDILSAYEYGFSLSEPVFMLDKVQQLYVYSTIKTRPPHSFNFNIDDYGNVMFVEQWGTNGAVKYKPDLFLHHVYQQQFGNPYGESDLSAAHNDWKAKKFIKKFMAIYLERFASPTVVGRYPATFERAEIDQFMDVVKSIQNNTTLLFPEGVTVDMLQNKQDSNETFIKAIDYLNTAIARAILVPDLMGLSGAKTEGGAYSLGVQQFEVFMGSINSDRQSLAQKLTDKLIQPLVRINFGDYPCQFKFIPFTEAKILEYAKLWVQAVNGKAWEPNDEEVNYLRKVIGFPQGEVKRPEPPTIQAPGAPGGPPARGSDGQDPKTSDNKMGAPTLYIPTDRDGNPLYIGAGRQLTDFEKKVHFNLIESVLDKRESKILNQLDRAAGDITADYVGQIRDQGLLTRFNPEKINQLQVRFLKPMNVIFNSYFQDIFLEAYDMAQRETIKQVQGKFTQALMPEQFQEIIRQESFKITGDYVTEVTKKARNILVDAIKAGIGEGEIVKLIRDEMDSSSERWLQTVVRTKTTEIYNQGRRSYWENNAAAKEIVEAYQFSAIMDDRTSAICSDLDEKVFQIGEDIQRVTPPLHFNCRSLLVPITKFETYDSEAIPTLDQIKELGGNLKNFSREGER